MTEATVLGCRQGNLHQAAATCIWLCGVVVQCLLFRKLTQGPAGVLQAAVEGCELGLGQQQTIAERSEADVSSIVPPMAGIQQVID